MLCSPRPRREESGLQVDYVLLYQPGSPPVDRDKAQSMLVTYLLQHWALLGIYQVDIHSLKLNCEYQLLCTYLKLLTESSMITI